MESFDKTNKNERNSYLKTEVVAIFMYSKIMTIMCS